MKNHILNQYHEELKIPPKYSVGDILYKYDPKAYAHYIEICITKMELKKTPHCRIKGFGYYPVYSISICSGYEGSVDTPLNSGVTREWIDTNLYESIEKVSLVKDEGIKKEILALEKKITEKRNLLNG